MDQQKLRTLVFEKTGVRIDVDDPVFALVALNEAVLAEAVERHVALLDDASRTLAARLRDGGADGAALAAHLRDGGAGSAAPAAPGDGPPQQRLIAIAAGAAVLAALLVLVGQAIFFKPAPPTAPVIQAHELSEAQAKAIRDGEKLARIVHKLDAKTRNAIQAELQKP